MPADACAGMPCADRPLRLIARRHGCYPLQHLLFPPLRIPAGLQASGLLCLYLEWGSGHAAMAAARQLNTPPISTGH